MNNEIKNKEIKNNENKLNDGDNDISERQKIERYIEREDMYLDLTYSDDILSSMEEDDTMQYFAKLAAED